MDALVGSARDLAAFDPDRFGGRVLSENPHAKTVLVAFEPGQFIPMHQPASELTLAVLEGIGEVLAGSEVFYVRAGDVAVIPAGEARGVKARSRMLVLHVVAPPPSAADHEQVGAGLAAGDPGFDGLRPATADPVAMIHAEHGDLSPHLAHIEEAAESMAVAAGDDVAKRLSTIVGFLRDHLMEHAHDEERDLYPLVDRLLRAEGGGTATMSRDHDEIAAMVDALGRIAAELGGRPPENSDRTEATRLLYGLAALLKVHFAKEEEVYLPLLERAMSPDEAEDLAGKLA